MEIVMRSAAPRVGGPGRQAQFADAPAPKFSARAVDPEQGFREAERSFTGTKIARITDHNP
jgi:hypothetical protein